MGYLGGLVFANGTLFNVCERIMHHQLAQEIDAFSQIVGIIFKIVVLCAIKLGGFMTRVQCNSGG